MRWHEDRMAAFDLETTGTDPDEARIVTAALVMVGGGHTTDSRTWLLDPGVDIPAEASAIHGITTEQAKRDGLPADAGAALIAEAVASVLPWTPLVIYNAPYDLTVLDRECRRHGVATLKDRLGQIGPVIDPMVLDKYADRFRKGSRRLGDVCRHYGVRLDGAHDSGYDALAAARVAWRLGERAHLPTSELRHLGYDQDAIGRWQMLATHDVSGLHDLQRTAKREQDTSFAEYLRRLAARAANAGERVDLLSRADSITGDWPLIPFRPADHQHPGGDR